MERLILSAGVFAMLGSGGVSARENSAGGEPLVVETFFDGELSAHGVILSRGGLVRRSFNAIMRGVWEEREGQLHGILTEDFLFDDGEKLLRRWDFIKTGEGVFSGTASDVKGTAVLSAFGNALRMDYALMVPVGVRKLVIDVEDWLWRMDAKVIVNKSTLRKWGFRAGEIITTIIKED